MSITETATSKATDTPCHWQEVLADSITDPDQLCQMLGLPPTAAEEARQAANAFGLLVPRPYLARIRPGDLQDPLLRQILPVRGESEPAAGFSRDPLCESDASPAAGLLAKYQGRSLIVTTGRCGVHCRFCFRRHRPSASAPSDPLHSPEILALLRADSSLHEVILSGGDPLTLNNDVLAACATKIAQIAHVRRLRLHTRMPIVVPQRVDADLLRWIGASPLTVSIVLHVNHPAEIDQPVADAIGQMADAGIPLFSQSVLLRGVNDQIDALAELFERLVDLRVTPYYLHQLDRVAGAAHFEVPEREGLDLASKLRALLPGYAVPRYVRDIPGNRNKQVLA
jgi:L-lysine 2,3-aminomutase